ncbi:MAG: alcohol dehydrogenase [Deltaproteobacteria bacterium GWA2_57_13]|nr:MAG: alcohol dehydrogenase [Deltaproteobacteria bacterium GWA2_57_13]OGQ51206.1 MAG: alcohol dehydrogenase [Deltaproteobacteria bacterium RIFCSPLOWO2_02_FULL_57_26]
MLAALLHAPRPVEEEPLLLDQITAPAPRGREIRIRVRACAVCHTDLHTVEGEIPLPKLPIVPGHQIVGVVDACGPEARRFREGDRVGVAWLHHACGECLYCRSGNENLCDTAQFTGLQADGGYAEFTLVDEDFAYFLPQGFSDFQAAPLLCAGVIGYRAFKMAGLRGGERLGLYGFGASAHLVIQIARHRQCEVYVFTRSAEHQDHARALGAAWVGRAEDTPAQRLQAAIIFAPAGKLALEALRVLDRGGKVILAGITMTPIPEIDYSALLYHERGLQSVANATRRDAEELLALAPEVPLRADVQVFPFSQVNFALRQLKHSRIRGCGIIAIDLPETGAEVKGS